MSRLFDYYEDLKSQYKTEEELREAFHQTDYEAIRYGLNIDSKIWGHMMRLVILDDLLMEKKGE